MAGIHALSWQIGVEGICVRREASLQKPRIEQRTNEVAELLGNPSIDRDHTRTFDDVLAPGYGQLNKKVHQAIQKAAHLEGILVDPVYSGRSLAGLIQLVRSGVIDRGSCVVFVHTGGAPALFAYQQKLGLQ